MDDTTMFRWMEGDSLAPPCQSEQEVIDTILEVIAPHARASSVLYDLGCGDGRICIAATRRFGCFSRGVEIEAELIDAFQSTIHAYQLEDKVQALHQDLLQVDLSDATIIVLYLLPEAIEQLRAPLLAFLQRGGFLVCNTWGVKGWEPIAKVLTGFAQNVNLFVFDQSSLPTDATATDATTSHP
jgi:SAM-dependent methyltransferase